MSKLILSKIKTKEDADTLMEEIDVLSSSMYEQKDDFETALNSKIRHWVAELIRQELQKGNGEKEDKEEVLKKIKSELEKIKIIKLSLAYEPSMESLELLSGWVKSNLSNSTVIEIHYRKDLIAGAIVEFEGEYRDFTVSKRLASVIESFKS